MQSLRSESGALHGLGLDPRLQSGLWEPGADERDTGGQEAADLGSSRGGGGREETPTLHGPPPPNTFQGAGGRCQT